MNPEITIIKYIYSNILDLKFNSFQYSSAYYVENLIIFEKLYNQKERTAVMKTQAHQELAKNVNQLDKYN